VTIRAGCFRYKDGTGPQQDEFRYRMKDKVVVLLESGTLPRIWLFFLSPIFASAIHDDSPCRARQPRAMWGSYSRLIGPKKNLLQGGVPVGSVTMDVRGYIQPRGPGSKPCVPWGNGHKRTLASTKVHVVVVRDLDSGSPKNGSAGL